MNYNLFPKLFMAIHQAAQDKDMERGMDLQNRFLAYADVFWRYGGIIPNFEALMREKGLAPYCFRRPRLGQGTATDRKFLDEVASALKAIEAAIQER